MPHGAIPFPFGDCRICNDKATGFHYGVATCEGCKGFFKRSIPKGDKYTCFFGGNCNITPFNRNRCKACRFQRCLENGMAIDAVKMGRIPKVEKERALLEARVESVGSSAPQPELNQSLAGVGQGLWSNPTDTSSSTQVPGKAELDHGMAGTSVSHKGGLSACEKTNIPHSQNFFHPAQWNKSQDSSPVKQKHYSHQRSCDRDSLQEKVAENDRQFQIVEKNQRQRGSNNLRKSQNFFEETDIMSRLDLRSTSGSPYQEQFTAPHEGNLMPSHTKPYSLPPQGNNAQASPIFCNPSANVTDTHSHFGLPVEVKIEPNLPNTQFPSPTQTVYCDNPFSHSSVSRPPQKDYPFTYPSATSEFPSMGFDSALNTGIMDPSEERRFAYQSGLSNNGTVSAPTTPTQGKGSGGSCLFSNLQQAVQAIENDSKELQQPRKNVSRRSSYSPDIIKVLLDQVGGERIKDMRQHIMTTIANTFGPEEYEATEKLLTSYTQSTEPQMQQQPSFHHTETAYSVQQPPSCLQTQSNKNLFPEDKNSFTQLLQPGIQNPLNDRPTMSAASQFHNSLHKSEILSQPPQQLSQYQGDKRMSFTDPNGQAENTVEMASGISDQQTQLDGQTNPVHFMGGMTSNLHKQMRNSQSGQEDVMVIQNTGLQGEPGAFRKENISDTNLMDTSNCCLSGDLCVPDLDTEQWLTGECGNGLELGTSEKSSVGTSSHNSRSEKESTSPDSSNMSDLTMSESIMTLTTAYEKHMIDVIHKYARMMDYLNNKKPIPFHPFTEEGKSKVYNNLIESIPKINKQIIGFCQDVPGFSALSKTDKEVLLKRGYYDVWMLMNSKLFHKDESYLQLGDGMFYTAAWMARILNPFMTQKFVTFSKKFNTLGLTDLEIAILCAIQLTATDHENVELENPNHIQQMNSHFVDLLVAEVSKHHHRNCSRVLVDIFRLMPDLAEINVLQQEIIANFSTENCPDKPKSPALADIPSEYLPDS